MNFRLEQKNIMNYKKGVMAIPSVPGSGKTFILTHLALSLHKNLPEGKNILLLTYMNSAVENFYMRLKSLDKNIENIQIKTIHKFCLDLIKENIHLLNISEDFLLLDNGSSVKIIGDIYKIWFLENEDRFKLFFNSNDYTKENREDFYNSLKYCCLNTISKAKNLGLDLKEAKEKRAGDLSLIELIVDFNDIYEKKLKELNYLDYDDLLVLAYNLVNDTESLRNKYTLAYSFILEDEAQDSNLLQNKIVNLLSRGNLIKVGDSNQNITGSFTSSSPAIFRNFSKKAEIKIELKNSGRSSVNLLTLANFFIKYTRLKHPATEARNALKASFIEPMPLGFYPENPKPLSFELKSCLTKDLGEEFILCVKKIKAFNKKYPDKSIGILAPRNNHLNVLASLLKKELLEFEILSDFSQNNLETYQKLADILNFIENPNNVACFIKIIETYLLKTTLSQEEKKDFYKAGIEKLFLENHLEKFKKAIEKLNLLLDFSINTKETVLIYIAESFDFDTTEIEIIANIALNLKSVFRFNPKWSYKDLINELKKVENNKLNYFNWGLSKKSSSNKKITLTTYHKSKGREWDMVYLLSVNEEFFPVYLHKTQQGEKHYLKEEYKILEARAQYELKKLIKKEFKSNPVLDYKTKKIEESLRVLYVGITRAKEYLIISSNMENEGIFYYKLFSNLIKKIEKR